MFSANQSGRRAVPKVLTSLTLQQKAGQPMPPGSKKCRPKVATSSRKSVKFELVVCLLILPRRWIYSVACGMGKEWMEIPREWSTGVTARGMLKAGFRARSWLAGSLVQHDLQQQKMCVTQHSFFNIYNKDSSRVLSLFNIFAGFLILSLSSFLCFNCISKIAMLGVKLSRKPH